MLCAMKSSKNPDESRLVQGSEPDTKATPFYISIAMFASVLGLFMAVYYQVAAHPKQWRDFASFGDSFGSLNTLFSGLAFAALVVTLWMQREELAMQRRELRESRIAQQESRDALRDQITAMNAQTDAISGQTVLAALGDLVRFEDAEWQRPLVRLERDIRFAEARKQIEPEEAEWVTHHFDKYQATATVIKDFLATHHAAISASLESQEKQIRRLRRAFEDG